METLYIDNRSDWRKWLSEHFRTYEEIWLVFPKKASGKKGISYNDAVEEALCFGWIDSIQKKLDADHSVQRFTPRRPKSHVRIWKFSKTAMPKRGVNTA